MATLHKHSPASDKESNFMMAYIAADGARDMPPCQCTNTQPAEGFARFARKAASTSSPAGMMVSSSVSKTETWFTTMPWNVGGWGAEGCSAGVTSGNVLSVASHLQRRQIDDSADVGASQHVLVVARGEIGNQEPVQDFVRDVTHSTTVRLEEWL